MQPRRIPDWFPGRRRQCVAHSGSEFGARPAKMEASPSQETQCCTSTVLASLQFHSPASWQAPSGQTHSQAAAKEGPQARRRKHYSCGGAGGLRNNDQCLRSSDAGRPTCGRRRTRLGGSSGRETSCGRRGKNGGRDSLMQTSRGAKAKRFSLAAGQLAEAEAPSD